MVGLFLCVLSFCLVHLCCCVLFGLGCVCDCFVMCEFVAVGGVVVWMSVCSVCGAGSVFVLRVVLCYA